MTGIPLGGCKGTAGNSEGGWPCCCCSWDNKAKPMTACPTVALGMSEPAGEQHKMFLVPRLQLHICSVFVIS